MTQITELRINGRYIKRRREELDLTQIELAKRANVSRGTVLGLECGHRDSAHFDTVNSLAVALDTPVTKLLKAL